MTPNKDGDRYFGNLNIKYEGEITDIINTANQKLWETNMRPKDKEI